MTSMKCDYTNRFIALGYTQEQIEKRLGEIVNTLFYGNMDERIYHEIEDMAYVEDTGNHDVRTEGMSYAMMVCVQMDMKTEFDKLWKFSKTFMFMTEGENAGYFAWSVSTEGKKNSNGPAPDGEEFFAMALFFAGNRWGNGEGIFNYTKEAKQLLSVCIHKGENGEAGYPMWNPSNKLIKFVPNLEFSDPSYHLPHFYRLFALWANEEDRGFWSDAAEASLAYLKKACHPITGLAAEYADYEGKPVNWQGHDVFYSDSYRVAANIGLYHSWFGDDIELCQCVNRLHYFFKVTVSDTWDFIFNIDGSRLEGERHDEKILHPVGLIATNAMGALATEGEYSKQYIQELYDLPLREGDRRYYDNFLYLFAWMGLAGSYQIWS